MLKKLWGSTVCLAPFLFMWFSVKFNINSYVKLRVCSSVSLFLVFFCLSFLMSTSFFLSIAVLWTVCPSFSHSIHRPKFVS